MVVIIWLPLFLYAANAPMRARLLLSVAPLVKIISFSVAPGETVGIVGESGSGKTAAVQALTRLTPAEWIEGRALFDG